MDLRIIFVVLICVCLSEGLWGGRRTIVRSCPRGYYTYTSSCSGWLNNMCPSGSGSSCINGRCCKRTVATTTTTTTTPAPVTCPDNQINTGSCISGKCIFPSRCYNGACCKDACPLGSADFGPCSISADCLTGGVCTNGHCCQQKIIKPSCPLGFEDFGLCSGLKDCLAGVCTNGHCCQQKIIGPTSSCPKHPIVAIQFCPPRRDECQKDECTKGRICCPDKCGDKKCTLPVDNDGPMKG